ncbi:MAG TPA: TadE/TadG family type IV pilus assembly protein [Candidatus Dormibacteraeota bacterium]
MPEFALVAPILFFIIFGIFDFGRGVYFYVSSQQAANEAARVAIQGEPFLGAAPYQPPTTGASLQAAIKDTGGVSLAAAPSSECTNGLINATGDLYATNTIPNNSGWIFLSDPETPNPSTTQPWTEVTTGAPNAPGGDAPVAPDSKSTCQLGVVPASGNQPLQATVIFHFIPVTPLIGNFVNSGKGIELVAYSVYRTEY